MDDDGWKSVKPYVGEKKINYPVVIGNDQVSHLYGDIDSLPTTFIVDREGKIASVHMGLVSKNAYEKEIQNLLGNEQRASLNALITRPFSEIMKGAQAILLRKRPWQAPMRTICAGSFSRRINEETGA